MIMRKVPPGHASIVAERPCHAVQRSSELKKENTVAGEALMERSTTSGSAESVTVHSRSCRTFTSPRPQPGAPVGRVARPHLLEGLPERTERLQVGSVKVALALAPDAHKAGLTGSGPSVT